MNHTEKKEVRKKMQNIKIHILVIDHAHGQNISAHGTEEEAQKALSEYVKENWEMDAQIPEDESEAIDAYFEEAAGRGLGHSESYSLEETTVKLAGGTR